MRIVHISSSDFPLTRQYGGTEGLVCDLAEKQLSEGHDVTVISAPAFSDTSLQPISLVKPTKQHSNYALNWFKFRVNGLKSVYKSYKWIGSNFDIIHNHLSEEGVALSFLRKTPCLTTLHGIAHERFPHHYVSRLYSLTRNTKLVSLSKSAYYQHKKFYGDDLIGYVSNGVNVDLFNFNPKIEKDTELEICSASRISSDKSVKEVIHVADVLHNRGINVHLKIIGKCEKRDLEYVKDVIKMIDQRSYVSKFLDVPRKKVKSLLRTSDVFVFPISKNEPFALAPLEAMACGTPVVTLRKAAALDYVEEGVNGFFCDSVSQMPDLVLRCLEINRKKCRETIEKRFSITNLYEHYMKIYDKVILMTNNLS